MLLYTDEENRQRLHLVMLSQDIKSHPLHFYINRPISTMGGQQFCAITHAVAGIAEHTLKMTAMDMYLANPIDDCALPDEDGMVLELTIMEGFNPTEVVTNLAEALGNAYDVAIWDIFVSGRLGQERPFNAELLMVAGMPEGYLEDESLLAQQEMVDS